MYNSGNMAVALTGENKPMMAVINANENIARMFIVTNCLKLIFSFNLFAFMAILTNDTRPT